MYPSADEKVYIEAAEGLMAKTMARYDPSHDVYHGDYHDPYTNSSFWPHFQPVQRVRKTAMRIATVSTPQPDLLIVELGVYPLRF